MITQAQIESLSSRELVDCLVRGASNRGLRNVGKVIKQSRRYQATPEDRVFAKHLAMLDLSFEHYLDTGSLRRFALRTTTLKLHRDPIARKALLIFARALCG